MAKRTTVEPTGLDPRSPESLASLIKLATNSGQNVGMSARYLLDKIDQLQAAGTWPTSLPDEPRTWERFCTDVLGYPGEYVEKMREGVAILVGKPSVAEAVTAAEAMRRKVADTQALQPHGTNQHSTTEELVFTNSSDHGNTKQYQIARLKRDRPDIADALARGEYPSVRAAAKAAGIVQDPTPLTLLQRAWTKAAPADHQGFFRWLLERADQYMAERRTPDEPPAPLEASSLYDDALVTQLLEVYDAAHAWAHDRDVAIEKHTSRAVKPDGTVVYQYPVSKSEEILDALLAPERAFFAKLAELSAVIDGYFSRADDSAEGQP